MRAHNRRRSSTEVFCRPVCTPNVTLIGGRRYPTPVDQPVKSGEDRAMSTATCNGIELWYETFGDDDGPPLLLVMGLGAQAIAWDTELCHAFADRGFRVIRFDNRDVG